MIMPSGGLEPNSVKSPHRFTIFPLPLQVIVCDVWTDDSASEEDNENMLKISTNVFTAPQEI